MYEWVHKLRIWLWQRQARMLERSCRPSGTSEGDWIGANVAASAASSGTGAGMHAGWHGNLPTCDTDSSTCGSGN
ncbi:hypothetical protein [Methylobacterium dankookense]|uniref:Uncharacterized protein n=1 Tax=Methylobacterium dankookense TaxID=560405 RepID=A0A564G114_9HYPH|nr:hypothetical protein [Methylobacterium dankookense]GJD55193.1 hypothetical protein IFDJLNFL_1076 [Methylobacterium dankookense]VUF14149.1 hypothetical protein MTDSW087_03864 [Methylobacterium dankookense]